VSQTIELDRLDWLEDGRSYSLSFFFAERHTTQSNFRIETTLELRTVQLPPTAALYD
jgi:fibro-slime domain-containing protein